MEKTILVGEKFSNITGPERDEFLDTLCDLSEQDDEDVILDFGGVSEIGSIALAAVGKMQARMQEQHRHLKVKGLSKHLYLVFELAGFTDVMDIEKNNA